MQTIALGKSSLRTSRLAYGCWRVAGSANPEEVTPERESAGVRAIHAAFDAGYNLFDHADIYCRGRAESIFGRALKEKSEMRDKILIATKCGIRLPGDPNPQAPHRYDFSADHIVYSCECSLKRLGVETIDLYQLHRPDFLADPKEVASAFSKLKEAGKVREFGVSNFRPSLVTALQKACPMPLIVHQVEISLAKLDCFTDGTLDQCLSDKMTPLAWSPLAGGKLCETLPVDLNAPEHAKRIAIRETLDLISRERNVSRLVIALAWLLKHPSGILPIIGSTDPKRIHEAVGAADLELTREEWYQLLNAARGEKLP